MSGFRRRLLVVAAAAAALALGLGWLLLGTEAGARWALERATPAEAEVTGVEGRLLGPLRLAGVRYGLPGGEAELAVEGLELDWSPLDLLSGRVTVRRLTVEELRLASDAELRGGARRRVPQPEPALEGLERLLGRPLRPPLPLALRVEALRVGRAEVRSPDFPEPVDLGEIELSGHADRVGVRLTRLRVDGRSASVEATGHVRPGGEGVDDGGDVWLRMWAELRLPGRPAAAGWLEADGTAERVDLRLWTSEPVRSRMQAAVRGPAPGLEWSLEWATGRIPISRLAAGSPLSEGALALTAEGAGSRAAGTLSLWAASGADLSFDGHVRARLDGDSVSVGEAVVRRSGTEAELRASGALAAADGVPRLRLDGSWRDLSWPLAGEPLAASPSGRFRVGGVRDSLHVQASAAGREPRLGDFGAELEALVFPDSTVLRRLALRAAGSPARVDITGTAHTGASPQRLRGRVQWADLAWPPAGGPEGVRSPSGLLEVDGTADDLSYRVEATAAAEALPSPLRLTASGRYGPGEVSADALRLDALGGRITGSARSALPPGRWRADLRAADLDPGLAVPPGEAGDGRISLRLRASGTGGPGGLTGSFRLDSITGTARGRRVDGFAHLEVTEEGVTADSLLARLGSARLEAAGGVRGVWDLTASLDAPDLGEIDPGASGAVRSTVSASGARADPELRVTLEADSAGLDTDDASARADRIEGAGRWRPSSGGLPELELAARGLEAGGLLVDSLSATVRPTEAGSRARLRLDGPAGRLMAAAGGRLSAEGWSGRIDSLELAPAAAGAWTLRDPVPVRASRDSASLGRLCVESGRSLVCGSADWSRAEGARWELRGDPLPLALASPWAPAALDLSGDLQLAADGSVDAAGDLRARGELTGRSLSLRVPAPGDTLTRVVDSLLVRGRSGPDSAAAEVDLSMADGGLLAASVDASRTRGGWGAVSGRVRAEIEDDGIAGAVVPELTSTGGRLTGSLTFDGEWPRPIPEGSLALEEGRADVVPLGLELRDVALAVSDAGPGTIRVTGGMRSGPGAASLEGTARFTPDEPLPILDLRLRGERLEVHNTSAVHLLVSPDLRVAGDASGLAVTGRVDVPEARIAPRRLEAPARPSPDVVVLGRQGEADGDAAARTLPAPPVQVDVEVGLGDRVRVEGLGLSGRLTGGVRVAARPDQPPTGRGEIEIVQGRYLAFQRSLSIDQGRLIFAGTPLDDPGLDLRITRRTAGVEVGMTVGGTARSPSFVLFSTPAMSETDLLSYLLFGRPVAAVTRFEGAVLRDAVQGVGLMGGEALAARLGTALGLDESRLVTEDGRATALQIGTSLSPRLTLGYSIGLFGAPNVLRIGYRVGRGWMLQAESGPAGGADVLYVIER